MNILHFKYAVEIAKTKSISKAAENLYMGQPNLSRAVKELEEYLGITIFTRTSKGVTVTAQGEEFLRYARRIMSQVELVEEKYTGSKFKRKSFSVCVPRASYISKAFVSFCRDTEDEALSEVSYRETNSMKTIESVSEGESSIGIIRYHNNFDKYFKSLFVDKRLSSETVSEFSYVLLINRGNPLAEKDNIQLKDLETMTQIAYADPYVPTVTDLDVKKSELSSFVKRHIFVFERASRYELLSSLPMSFMWVSPVSQDLLDKYNLVQKNCAGNKKIYRDVLIYRKGHKLSPEAEAFVAKVKQEAKKHL